MKFFALVASFVFLSLISTSKIYATGGSPPNPSHGGLTCSAFDSGHEEHWGGHSTCSECQVKHHGSCVERCSRNEYTCTAEGTRDDGSIDSVSAFDQMESYARDRAMERCYYSHLRNCRISNCVSNSSLVSTRKCL